MTAADGYSRMHYDDPQTAEVHVEEECGCDPAPAAKQPGVYLIHAEEPIRHAQHYLGSAADIPARVEAHRGNRGAALTRAFNERGIGWQVARTWPAADAAEARGIEIALKNRRDSPRICPECSPGTTRAAAPEPATRRTAAYHPPVRRPAPDAEAEPEAEAG